VLHLQLRKRPNFVHFDVTRPTGQEVSTLALRESTEAYFQQHSDAMRHRQQFVEWMEQQV
jgi:hypothetical protein